MSGNRPDISKFNPHWRPKTVAIWQDWHFGKFRCFKKTFDGPWHLERSGEVIFTDENLVEVMDHAQSISEAKGATL